MQEIKVKNSIENAQNYLVIHRIELVDIGFATGTFTLVGKKKKKKTRSLWVWIYINIRIVQCEFIILYVLGAEFVTKA